MALNQLGDIKNVSNLELNDGDNFIFGADVSASMNAADCPGNMKRIDFLKETMITFIGEAAKHDSDGIDIITFGHQVKHIPNVTAPQGAEIIKGLVANEAATATDQLIRKAYEVHKANGYQQTVLFVATDGAPSSPDGVRQAIRDICNDLSDEHAFAISFLIVGTPDANLAGFLSELDNLDAKYDIVDVKNLTEVDFMSAFVGALHD